MLVKTLADFFSFLFFSPFGVASQSVKLKKPRIPNVFQSDEDICSMFKLVILKLSYMALRRSARTPLLFRETSLRRLPFGREEETATFIEQHKRT